MALGYPAAMDSYNAIALLRHALSGHRRWQPAWRSPDPAEHYDVVIIGAGGHGLATAYYLATNHGIRNVAVLDRGWLGGGNTGRNTQVCRSNYFYPESAAFYEHSLRLYENLSAGLDFNVMLSQRGVLELFPSFGRLRIMRQWAGICDIAPDASPIVGPTPIDNLFVSTGWGTGGYKAIPAGGDTLAHTIATGRTHELLRPFQFDRFGTGRLVDEGAAAGVAH